MKFHIRLALLLFLIVSFLQSEAQEDPKKRPTIGLVLSGGGAKGFAHIGVLKAIQESGLEFDYIAGTSMGALMGGLYAMGYSPDFLEQMVSEQNWTDLIRDNYPRKYLNINEKGDDEKFFLNIPFTKKGFGLPSGLIEAQEISLLLSYLCAPAYQTRDFGKLQTPFLCVGADLETITPIVIDHGDLPHALRSSMAILGYFSTTEYDGCIITDGGLIDNFPVLELKERGIDIVIGIDVQSPRLERDDLHSLTSDIWHVIDQHSLRAQEGAVESADIYIHPNITGYDMMSFSRWDSLISRGEQAGRQFLPQLKALADSLNAIEYKPQKIRDVQPVKKVYIEKIEYVGLKNVSHELLDNYKKFKAGEYVAISDIEQWIHLASGTKYFTLLRYELYPGEKGAILRLYVHETIGQSIGASLHFDSDYKAAVNLKGTFRNWFIHGSKANIILSLGGNVLISADYSINRGMRPSLGLSLDASAIDMYRYEKGIRSSMFRFMDISFTPLIRSLYKNYIDIALGVQVEYSGQKPIVDYFSLDKINDGFLNVLLNTEFDTRNSLYYATKGSYFSLSGKMIKGIAGDRKNDDLYWFGTFHWNTAVQLSKRVALRPGISLVASTANANSPIQYQAYLGGIEYAALPGLIPFIGVENMSFSGNYAYVAHCEMQYRLYRQKVFLIGTLDVGDIQMDFSGISSSNDIKCGGGLTVSYNSFIGPLSISITGSNKTKGVRFFINIGHKI